MIEGCGQIQKNGRQQTIRLSPPPHQTVEDMFNPTDRFQVQGATVKTDGTSNLLVMIRITRHTLLD
jgi:hypothetical protein